VLVSAQHFVNLVVEFSVLDHSYKVIVNLFSHGDHQHEAKRPQESEQKANFEERHKLRKSYSQEEQVRELTELCPQNLWQKGAAVVFLIIELV
jgi:hypothetical protein